MESMTNREFRDMVELMLETQQEYFKEKKQQIPGAYLKLEESKKLEARVRKALKRFKEDEQQKPLWGTEGADQVNGSLSLHSLSWGILWLLRAILVNPSTRFLSDPLPFTLTGYRLEG
jgi:hypothetical protein